MKLSERLSTLRPMLDGLIALLLVMSASACTTALFKEPSPQILLRIVTPELQEYDPEFLLVVREELDSLGEEPALSIVVQDYLLLRDQIRALEKANENPLQSP